MASRHSISLAINSVFMGLSPISPQSWDFPQSPNPDVWSFLKYDGSDYLVGAFLQENHTRPPRHVKDTRTELMKKCSLHLVIQISQTAWIFTSILLSSLSSGADREGEAALRRRAGRGGRDKVPDEDGGVGQGRLLGLQAGQGPRRSRRGRGRSHARGK